METYIIKFDSFTAPYFSACSHLFPLSVLLFRYILILYIIGIAISPVFGLCVYFCFIFVSGLSNSFIKYVQCMRNKFLYVMYYIRERP